MKNSFGKFFRITTFGESHGEALGVVIDGCPAGVHFNQEFLNQQMRRRRPGAFGGASDKVVSQRKEEDAPEILSGVFQDKTLGTPITIITRNKDARSKDYDEIKKEPRIGHADDVWKEKFQHVDHRGGGRSSGRETVSRVMAGAVAEMYLKQSLPELEIIAYSSQIGPFQIVNCLDEKILNRESIDQFAARFPDSKQVADVENLLLKAKEEGKSYGGSLKLVIKNPPAGLGQPVFHKLKADLSAALMSIGATSSVCIGDNNASVSEGTEFHKKDSDNYGGIRGGISTGEDIHITLSFKPTSSVMDVAKRGRHDPCIVTRAIPVAEAMAALVIADHFMWMKLDRI